MVNVMAMRTVGISMSEDEYKKLNELRHKDGTIRSASKVLREIVIPVLMNGHKPENVSPPDVETKNEEVKQDVSQDMTQIKPESTLSGLDDINLDF